MKTFKALLLIVALMVSASAFASTISIFGGKSISNSLSDEKSNAWGVEQEVIFSKGRVWQFGYLNEGHKPSTGDKRDGLYAMYKLPYNLTERLVTSFSAGPYFTATTIGDQSTSVSTLNCDCSFNGSTTTTINNQGAYHDSYHLSLLTSVATRYYVTPLVDVELRWNHVMFTKGSLSRPNTDADVFLAAIGYDFK